MTSTSSVPAPAHTALRERLVAHFSAADLDLPILPAAAAQVLQVSNEATCDAKKLANVIQSDPAMAGHVLRVANSSAYAPREPIVSLQQAVSRLGFTVVRDIAVAVALHGKVFVVEGHDERIKNLWLHSAATGAWAKEIARLRRRNVEGAFLCGLLHDVGKPVVLQALADLTQPTREPLGEAATVALMDEFHTTVGERLVSCWSMPEWIAAAVRWHHHPEDAEHDAEIAQCACLADLLAHWTFAPDAAREAELRNHSVLAALSLYTDEMEELMQKRDEIAATSQAFA